MALLTDLISCWELGEASGSRADAHGSNTLTDNNTVLSATGKVGDGADFESTNSEYLSSASNSSLEMGDIDFTIAAWVKVETNQSHMIVTKDDDALLSRDYTLDYDATSKFRFYLNGGGGNIAMANVDLTTVVGTWYFVVAWHDAAANVVKLQVNDGTVASDDTTGIVPNVSAAQFRIGAREYAGAEGYFDGVIDQVCLWKRLLTAAERTELYDSGNGLSYAGMGGVVFRARKNLPINQAVNRGATY